MTKTKNGQIQKELVEALGISREAVRLLVGKGMPTDSVKAAKSWRAKHIASQSDGFSIGEARLAKAKLDVINKQLDLEERRRNLVKRADAEKVLFDEARRVRDSFQTFGARVAPILAARFGIDHGAMLNALDDEMRRHLAELADPKGIP
jgi:hypothetical protein